MSLFSYPDVNKGKAGKVESSKEGKEGRVENCHHCVTAGEGALERIWVCQWFLFGFVSDFDCIYAGWSSAGGSRWTCPSCFWKVQNLIWFKIRFKFFITSSLSKIPSLHEIKIKIIKLFSVTSNGFSLLWLQRLDCVRAWS